MRVTHRSTKSVQTSGDSLMLVQKRSHCETTITTGEMKDPRAGERAYTKVVGNYCIATETANGHFGE